MDKKRIANMDAVQFLNTYKYICGQFYGGYEPCSDKCPIYSKILIPMELESKDCNDLFIIANPAILVDVVKGWAAAHPKVEHK